MAITVTVNGGSPITISQQSVSPVNVKVVGATGPAGATGATGPTGPAGADGADGKTYTISCVDGDNSDEEKIRLTDNDGTTDDVVLEAGTGMSIARSGDKITLTNTATDTNLGNTDQTLAAARDVEMGGNSLTFSNSDTVVHTITAASGVTFNRGITVTGTSAGPSTITLREDTDNGTNFVRLSAPSDVGSNLTLVLPSADGSANQVLATDGSGTLSFVTRATEAYVDTAANTLTENTQTGTTYTTVLTDAGKMITCNNGSAITVTIPPNSSVAYEAGTVLSFIQKGAGQVTLSAGVGVTLNNANGLKTASQYSVISCWKEDTDTWIVYGDTTS